MKSMTSSLLAATLLAIAAGAAAAPIGGLPPMPADPGVRGPWEARVRWVSPHTDPRSGQHYTYQYMTITGPTMESCQQQLASVMASPGVSVVEFCAPA